MSIVVHSAKGRSLAANGTRSVPATGEASRMAKHEKRGKEANPGQVAGFA